MPHTAQAGWGAGGQLRHSHHRSFGLAMGEVGGGRSARPPDRPGGVAGGGGPPGGAGGGVVGPPVRPSAGRGGARGGTARGWGSGVALVHRLLVLLLGSLSLACSARDGVVVGSKNFTESVILGEIIAQEVEHRGVPAVRKLNLGGSFVCHQAMLAGDLDVYVEYTGTAYAAILEFPPERDPQRVRAVVDSVYAERWQLLWTGALGFENTFAMLIRGETARRHNLTKMSEAVPYATEWRGGFGYEFLGREDGYPGLLEWYGLELDGTPAGMEPGLMYRALADGTVDIVAGNSTDGQIAALDLFQLEDDLRYFPPYDAAPVVRRAAVERHAVLRDVLRDLGGTISADRMRRLNYLVDVERRDVRDVVAEFLEGLRRDWGGGSGER